MKFAWTEKDKERFFKRAERQLKAAGIDFVQVDREQIGVKEWNAEKQTAGAVYVWLTSYPYNHFSTRKRGLLKRLCERCGEPAKIVHHKIWLTPKNIHEQSITLCWDNLEALCQDCHNKEHHAKNVRAKRYAFTADGELIPPIQKNIFRSR